MGQVIEKVSGHGVHATDHQEHPETPDDAKLQTYVALEIEGKFRVIPPSGMEKLIQNPSPDELDGSGQHHTEDEYHQGILLVEFSVSHGLQQAEHRQHPETVYGADRSVEEAPVHHDALGDGLIDHLGAPAQE